MLKVNIAPGNGEARHLNLLSYHPCSLYGFASPKISIFHRL